MEIILKRGNGNAIHLMQEKQNEQNENKRWNLGNGKRQSLTRYNDCYFLDIQTLLKCWDAGKSKLNTVHKYIKALVRQL